MPGNAISRPTFGVVQFTPTPSRGKRNVARKRDSLQAEDICRFEASFRRYPSAFFRETSPFDAGPISSFRELTSNDGAPNQSSARR